MMREGKGEVKMGGAFVATANMWYKHLSYSYTTAI